MSCMYNVAWSNNGETSSSGWQLFVKGVTSFAGGHLFSFSNIISMLHRAFHRYFSALMLHKSLFGFSESLCSLICDPRYIEGLATLLPLSQ